MLDRLVLERALIWFAHSRRHSPKGARSSRVQYRGGPRTVTIRNVRPESREERTAGRRREGRLDRLPRAEGRRGEEHRAAARIAACQGSRRRCRGKARQRSQEDRPPQGETRQGWLGPAAGRSRDRRLHDSPTLALWVTRSSSSCSNCSPNPLVLPDAIAWSSASFEEWRSRMTTSVLVPRSSKVTVVTAPSPLPSSFVQTIREFGVTSV